MPRGGGSSGGHKRKFDRPGQGKLSSTLPGPHDICQFYKDTGKCKFGAKCRTRHVDPEGTERRPRQKQDRNFSFNVSKTNKKKHKGAFKVRVQVSSTDASDPGSELDSLIKGFCTIGIQIMSREFAPSKDMSEISLSMMNVKLHQENTFVYDTGSAEGISTSKSDFYRLDLSERARDSVIINGPSVGSPLCGGRGCLIFTFEVNNVMMGMVHPNGIYATTNDAQMTFRLASAQELKRLGIRLIGGAFKEPDVIECVRTRFAFETSSQGKLMVVTTKGKASDIKPSEMFHSYLDQVKNGHQSPLFQLSRVKGELPITSDKEGEIYEYMCKDSIGDEYEPKDDSTYAVEAEFQRWNDFNALSSHR
jgi:hypothetical protein